MSFNKEYFQEAYNLAESAKGNTGINPNVGAVIVKDDVIIGTGFTRECGQNHAEIEALLQAGEEAKGAELYVTLEPCCCDGKTPPCTDAIIKAGIVKVYAGIEDPNPKVSGAGFQALEVAGIEVVRNIEPEKIKKQLQVYLTNIEKHRPYFIMKNAVSLDGKIACRTGASKWISCPFSREYVHRLRREIRVILTGINTVLRDDPLLDVRLDEPEGVTRQTKLRIVLDAYLRIPRDSILVKTAEKIPVLVFKSKDHQDHQKEQELIQKGVEIVSVSCNETGELSLLEIIEVLNEKEIAAVLIEAGGSVNTSFFKEKLVDKIYYIIAPKILGGDKTVVGDLKINVPKEAIKLKRERILDLEGDILIIAYPDY